MGEQARRRFKPRGLLSYKTLRPRERLPKSCWLLLALLADSVGSQGGSQTRSTFAPGRRQSLRSCRASLAMIAHSATRRGRVICTLIRRGAFARSHPASRRRQVDNVDRNFRIVTGLELSPRRLLKTSAGLSSPPRAPGRSNRRPALDPVESGLTGDEDGERSAERLGDDDLRAGWESDFLAAGDASDFDVSSDGGGGLVAHGEVAGELRGR